MAISFKGLKEEEEGHLLICDCQTRRSPTEINASDILWQISSNWIELEAESVRSQIKRALLDSRYLRILAVDFYFVLLFLCLTSRDCPKLHRLWKWAIVDVWTSPSFSFTFSRHHLDGRQLTSVNYRLHPSTVNVSCTVAAFPNLYIDKSHSYEWSGSHETYDGFRRNSCIARTAVINLFSVYVAP